MEQITRTMKRLVACGAAALMAGLGSAGALAQTNFEKDVTTAIDKGLAYLAVNGAYNNPPGLNPDASGLPMLALLEKRRSGLATDPPQGYIGASDTDKARLRSAATYILRNAKDSSGSFFAYRDGAQMFALASYALTVGPDKLALITSGNILPGEAGLHHSIKEAMDDLVDRTLAAQRKAPNYTDPANQGYWCYYNDSCEDSSTTQFAAAGLHAANTFYKSIIAGDAPYADPVRVLAINNALALVKTAYELNALPGSDYGAGAGNCQVMTATEKGHGYNAKYYPPTLAQTASGIYIQQFGGANVNSPVLQNYMEWLRNRYRWQDLDNLGNYWPYLTWSYYMWSSFKGMELLRQSGITPLLGNVSPSSLGTLPAGTSAPSDCVARQVNKTASDYARVPSFGPGAVGYYAAEPKSQYFDYAHQILSLQCPDGGFFCNGSPSYWDEASHQAYQLLVLQRSTGVVISKCDADGNGRIDSRDINLIRMVLGTTVGTADVRDGNNDGKVTSLDVRYCQNRCTSRSCAQ